MKHIFDIDIAKQFGVNAAIILENLGYWIKQNEANETNKYDGTYWTYNSRRAYKEIFPYMSERQIETAFRKLIDAELVITGNYNKVAYDRTLWYALSKKGKCILHFDGMDSDVLLNGNSQNVKPIPDINTDIKSNINTDINIIVDYLNSKANTSFRSASKKTQSLINARLAEGFTVDDFKTVINKKCAEWRNTDMSQYLRPETLFGAKFEGYLNAKQILKGKNGITVDSGSNQNDIF